VKLKMMQLQLLNIRQLTFIENSSVKNKEFKPKTKSNSKEGLE